MISSARTSVVRECAGRRQGNSSWRKGGYPQMLKLSSRAPRPWGKFKGHYFTTTTGVLLQVQVVSRHTTYLCKRTIKVIFPTRQKWLGYMGVLLFSIQSIRPGVWPVTGWTKFHRRPVSMWPGQKFRPNVRLVSLNLKARRARKKREILAFLTNGFRRQPLPQWPGTCDGFRPYPLAPWRVTAELIQYHRVCNA
jgi:hypothetical protein